MRLCSRSKARPVSVRRPIVVSISSAFASMAMLSNAQGQLAHATAKHAEPGARSNAAAIAEHRQGLSPGMLNAIQVSQATSGSAHVKSPDRQARSGESVTLDTISVVEQGNADPADQVYRTPGSSAYISSEQIERFRGTSVGDFLSGIPGVMNADSRNSGAVDVNIRGMQGQGRVPVIIDGATQETTVWQGYNGATPRTYIDPDFISSVSIEKGLSSAADATGATGGVVRASTIGVKDILLPDQRFGIRLKGGFTTNSSRVPAAGTDGGWSALQTSLASFGGELPPAYTQFSRNGMNRPSLLEPTGGSGSLAIAAVTEYVDVAAAYARRKNGNYHAGTRGGDGARLIAQLDRYGGMSLANGGLSPYRGGEEILNTSSDSESWMLKTTLKPAPGHSLELGYRKYMSDYGSSLTSRHLGMHYQSWLSTIDFDTYTARYRWKPLNQDLTILSVDAFQTVIDNRINALDLFLERDFSQPYAPIVGREFSPFYQWIGSKRRGITASHTVRAYTALGEVTLNSGGAFVREDVGLPAGVGRDWYVATYKFAFPRSGWREEASGFSAIEWRPVDRLTLNASARYSSFVTKDGLSYTRKSFKRHDHGWSPMASITVEPLSGLQLYMKHGKVVRAPSIFESLTGVGFYAPVESNPIGLERARNLEIGFNFLKNGVVTNGDKLRLHAAYFDNRIDGYLSRAELPYPDEFSPGDYIGVLTRINLDFAKMRGFELSAEYDAGHYFGGVSWNHYTGILFCAPKRRLFPGEQACSSGGLAHSFSLQQVPPKDTVTVNLGSRLLDNRLALGARVNYVGSRFAPGVGKNIGIGGVQPSRWNPYLLVDAYASYKLNKHVQFDLAVDNITDRYYMDAINAALMPAPGRTIRGSVTVRY